MSRNTRLKETRSIVTLRYQWTSFIEDSNYKCIIYLIKPNFQQIFHFFSSFLFRKCGSPKKQNLSAIGRVLGAASVPSTSSDKSQLLIVPSRSFAFEVTGDIICPGFVQGIDHLRDPRLNKVNKIAF